MSDVEDHRRRRRRNYRRNGLAGTIKTVLINPPNPDPPPSYFGPPYGLSLLGAVLGRAGHPVHGHDCDRWTRAEALGRIPAAVKRGGADVVGISCQSSNRWSALALADEVKRLSPQAAVVIGGPFATVAPEFVLERSRADFAAVGDGEETLLELVESLKDGRPAQAVRGLAFRSCGAVRKSPARGPFLDLDSLPYPAFHLFAAARQLTRLDRPPARVPDTAAGRRAAAVHSALMVLGSRGCVHRCVFCPMSGSRGPVRRHSPEYVAGMLAHLARRYGWRRFVFGDNYFTLDRGWAREICERLIGRGPSLDWICMTRPDAVDPGLLRRMALAGCREISYGLESGSPLIQKRIGKNIRMDRVAPALLATRQAGISSVLMLMVGSPGESRRTIRETAAFCRDLEPDRLLIHTTRVYPGTKLHDLADRQGVIPEDFYDRDDPHAPPYTGELSLRELASLRGMLQPRTVYVSARAGCGNGCCSLRRPPAGGGRVPLGRLIALASLRAERIVLGGGDPFLRKDLPALLKLGRRLQVHGLWFYTTGRPLARMRTFAPLLQDDLVRGIVVPLFSPEPQRHDRCARVEGALLQTRLGMLRWKKAGGSIEAWAFLDRDNIVRLPEWLRWLAGHGVANAVFIHGCSPSGWGRAPWRDLPRLRDSARALREARPLAERLGVGVASFGIPECLAPDRAFPHAESRHVFDEALSPGGEPVALGARRRRRLKVKPQACRKCRLRQRCEGVWPGYLRVNGDEEFRAR